MHGLTTCMVTWAHHMVTWVKQERVLVYSLYHCHLLIVLLSAVYVHCGYLSHYRKFRVVQVGLPQLQFSLIVRPYFTFCLSSLKDPLVNQ